MGEDCKKDKKYIQGRITKKLLNNCWLAVLFYGISTLLGHLTLN